MSISKEKWEQIVKRMEALGIGGGDLVEKFLIGSGKGGQKLQKSATCVYLKHLPTGIEVKCQKVRLREDNRFFARRILCEKLEEKIFQEKSSRQKTIEKVRQQKRKKTARQKKKMLEEKQRRSEKKRLRQSPEEA
ncbi:MAG: peptide chain release factor-like protein [Chlamydiota bacterium]